MIHVLILDDEVLTFVVLTAEEERQLRADLVRHYGRRFQLVSGHVDTLAQVQQRLTDLDGEADDPIGWSATAAVRSGPQ